MEEHRGGVIVAKFGGTSGAEAEDNRRKLKIVGSASGRVAVMVSSAAGLRNPTDTKVTDNLIICAELARREEAFDKHFDQVQRRYSQKGRELGIYGIFNELDRIYRGISENRANSAWTASRGDYLESWLDAQYTGREFVDASEFMRIGSDGLVDPLSYTLARTRFLPGREYATPGFYGIGPDGQVATLPRGGSDITGAIAIFALDPDMGIYENWKGVSGVYHPSSMKSGRPRVLSLLTYSEMGRWSREGAEVLHHSVCDILDGSGIVTHIRNTFDPMAPGTRIYTRIPNQEIGLPAFKTGVSGLPAMFYGGGAY